MVTRWGIREQIICSSFEVISTLFWHGWLFDYFCLSFFLGHLADKTMIYSVFPPPPPQPYCSLYFEAICTLNLALYFWYAKVWLVGSHHRHSDFLRKCPVLAWVFHHYSGQYRHRCCSEIYLWSWSFPPFAGQASCFELFLLLWLQGEADSELAVDHPIRFSLSHRTQSAKCSLQNLACSSLQHWEK